MASPINIDSLLLKVKNRRLFVLIVVAVAGAFLGGVFIIKPGLKRMTTLRSEIASLAQKKATYQFLVDSEKKAEVYKARFPANADKSWLVEKLNTLANDSDLPVTSIQPEEKETIEGHLQRTSIHIDAEAGFHELGEFVSRVENLEPFVKILDLSLRVGDAPAGMTATPGAPAPAVRSRPGAGPEGHRISMSIGLFTPTEGAL